MTKLFCLLGSCYVYMDDFHTVLLNNTASDGDLVLFSTRYAASVVYPNISKFVIGDEPLRRYLGVTAPGSVIVEMAKNSTDFDVYDVPTNFEWSETFVWDKSDVKVFVQPRGLNSKLNLEYAETLTSSKLQITLIYDDVTAAEEIAVIMNGLKAFFPRVIFRCWDTVEADVPFQLPTLPQIASSSEVSGVLFQQGTVTEHTLRFFIQANIDKMKVFRSVEL